MVNKAGSFAMTAFGPEFRTLRAAAISISELQQIATQGIEILLAVHSTRRIPGDTHTLPPRPDTLYPDFIKVGKLMPGFPH